jgi:hypothetical protein
MAAALGTQAVGPRSPEPGNAATAPVYKGPSGIACRDCRAAFPDGTPPHRLYCERCRQRRRIASWLRACTAIAHDLDLVILEHELKPALRHAEAAR